MVENHPDNRAESRESQAATLVEQGKGCPALENYLIGQTESKEGWKKILQSVVEANQAHRQKDPTLPELTVVTKPDWRGGETVGVSRKDLQEQGERYPLVDRIFVPDRSPRGDFPLAYDCHDAK